jgi:hypothetical protein
MDHLTFILVEKNSANSRSIVLIWQNIDDTKEVLRLYGKYVRAVLYVLNDLWTIDLQRRERVNVKFWPWISSTTRFIGSFNK